MERNVASQNADRLNLLSFVCLENPLSKGYQNTWQNVVFYPLILSSAYSSELVLKFVSVLVSMMGLQCPRSFALLFYTVASPFGIFKRGGFVKT